MSLIAVFLLMGMGIVAGAVAGLLGVGGGIVIVPTLQIAAPSLLPLPHDQTMHVIIATSVALALPTALRSTYSHFQRGGIEFAIIKLWGPPLALGAGMAGAMGRFLSGDTLLLIFATVAILVGLLMAGGRIRPLASGMPCRGIQAGLAGLAGMISAWMGIGGGTLTIPMLSLFGLKIHKAVGTGAALGVCAAAPALIGWMWAGLAAPDIGRPALGFIALDIWAILTPPMVLAPPLGVAIAYRLNTLWLKRIFGIALILTGIKLLPIW